MSLLDWTKRNGVGQLLELSSKKNYTLFIRLESKRHFAFEIIWSIKFEIWIKYKDIPSTLETLKHQDVGK